MRNLGNTNDFLNIVADASEPLNEILSDEELKQSFRSDSIILFIGKVAKKHREQLKAVVAAFDGDDAGEDVFDKYSPGDLVRMYYEVINHKDFKELKQAFSSALRRKGASSSGNAQEIIPE